MNAKEYEDATALAGEIVQRAMRGAVRFREAPGVTGEQIAQLAWWYLKQYEALKAVAPLLPSADPELDPFIPHYDKMRNKKDGVA